MDDTTEILPDRPQRRYDPYLRLLSRFYEPLVLLEALGRSRDSQDTYTQPANSLEQRRQRMLKNLCYLCDYNRGGATTTSMAISETAEGFTVWAAANTEDAQGSIVAFAQGLLDELRGYLRADDEALTLVVMEQDLLSACIGFAYHKLAKQVKMLRNEIRRCSRTLGGSAEDTRMSCLLCPSSWPSMTLEKS